MGPAGGCKLLYAIDFKEKSSLDLCITGPNAGAGALVSRSRHLHRSQSCKAIEAILEHPCNRIPLFTPASP
jgi:hypothetical protein